jgi:CBS domain-containing protein
MKITDVLKYKGSKVITIHPGKSIKNAVDLLEEHDIGALIVLDDIDQIVGIVSERDLIRYASSENPVFSTSVREIMTRNVIVGMLQDDINSVAHTMTENRFRHLPVVDNGRLVGILSIGDVVKAQRDRYEGELHTLQIQVIAATEQE